jgi:hypothetical protein
MRFLCLYRPGKPETNAPPSDEETAALGKLIDEMAKAGVLLATEGCLPSSTGMRVRIDRGKFSITDGPFPETKELIQGFCLMQVKTKAEAVEWCKRFLNVVGEGENEIRQIYEGPPSAA